MAFNGINHLRDAYEHVEVDAFKLNELAKCARDPIYFIRNYVYINTKDNGMQLFNLYGFQEELIGKFERNRFNIVKFPRQCGKSATTRGYILWYALFNKSKVVAILANKLNLAQEQLQQLRDSYAMLPYWMQPGVKQWNKRAIEFSHGTRIMCAATSPDGIRGMSINCVTGDSNITVRDRETGEIKQMSMESLYNELGLYNTSYKTIETNNTLYIQPDIEFDFSNEDNDELQ